MTNIKHLMHRILDVGSGVFLSFTVSLAVFPLYDLPVVHGNMVQLSIIFATVSIFRSYIWSRYIFKYK